MKDERKASSKSQGAPSPPLADELRKRMKAQGLAQDEAAKAIGIKAGTLRNWLSANKYEPDGVVELAKALDLPTELDALHRQFEFEETSTSRTVGPQLRRLPPRASWPQVFAALDARVRRIIHQDEFGQDVHVLFKSMTAGDVFVYWSLSELPYETQLGEGWDKGGREVARAIAAKATFIYLYPTDDVIAQMQNAGLTGLRREGDFKAALDGFRTNIAKVESSIRKGQLDNHLIALPCSVAAFLAPHHKYVLFRCRSEGAIMTRALIWFPVRGHADEEAHLHLPLGPTLTGHLFHFVRGSLERANRSDLMQRLL